MANDFVENAIFPTDISDGSVGGPMFLTFVQNTQSAFEQRIGAWPYGRHYYEVQYGIKTAAQGYALLKFFHSVRGKLFGFRYLDPMDYKSCDITETIAIDDQVIVASADGGETTSQLIKAYDTAGQITHRPIKKPISGSVLLAINTVAQTEGVDFTINYATGEITYTVALTSGDLVTAGFSHHVACRFDTDKLPLSLRGPLVSDTRIPVIEMRT